MDNKYYVCVKDYGSEGLKTDMTGKAMTISAWKKWMIKTRLDDLAEIGGLFEEEMTADIVEMLNVKEEDAIKYVRDYYDMRIIPLEDNSIKFIDMDANGKLMREDELRKVCLELEQADLYNNFEDYKHNDLDLNIHFDYIKKCLYGDIENVLEEIGNFGAWVIQIEFID